MMRNVQEPLHALGRNVWTLATLTPAASTPSARSEGTTQSVSASLALSGTPSLSVKSVRFNSEIGYRCKLAFKFRYSTWSSNPSLAAGCKSDLECPFHLACIDRDCQDPCLYENCGINAQCSVNNHQAKCECRPGFKGNPYQECRQYECLTDPECADTLACRNEKCVDPCDCAINADCTAINHRGICECRPGYEGDPYGRICLPSKCSDTKLQLPIAQTGIINKCLLPFEIVPDDTCKGDGDCPSRQACIDKECVNPCVKLQPCAQNAQCTVHNSLPKRTMSCKCDPGYTGKGDEFCDKISK